MRLVHLRDELNAVPSVALFSLCNDNTYVFGIAERKNESNIFFIFNQINLQQFNSSSQESNGIP